MLLFFKAIYRDPILRGEKTDTIRRPIRLPRVGSLVKACVGPSRIFATLRILEAAPIGSLTPERASQVLSCYPDVTSDMVRLRFELVSEDQLHHDSTR
jgi:hypothetical protein